jgi:conflict system pore-forming effector with SLATT domain
VNLDHYHPLSFTAVHRVVHTRVNPVTLLEPCEKGGLMFQLSLVDHLRLTFGHVVYRQRAHSQLALSLSRWSRRLRAAEVVLMVGVAFSAGAAAVTNVHAYAVLSAVLAGLAVLMLLASLMMDLDVSAQTHMVCAGRLWLIRERYRALMTDLVDGAIDLEGARRGRDLLMNDLHTIYERASVVDQQAYESASKAVAGFDDVSLSDEEIDHFLPKSLQKTTRNAA